MTSISVVDFETNKIENRPNYPPKPAGVAIRWPDGRSEYCAFGHPTENNCDVGTARRKVKDAFTADKVIFHHSEFDIDVADKHLLVSRPERVEDTLFQAFLDDPYAPELGLKELGQSKLGIKATARDKLKEWVLANVKGATDKKWGEHIAKAPGKLVGRYAIGDVDTTYGLYKHYRPIIRDRGMNEAYERELACAPISTEMERSGIRVHRKRLAKARDIFVKLDKDMLRVIAKRLRIDPKSLKSDENPKGFNLNSGAQLGDALKKARKLSCIIKTPSGKGISTSMDSLRTMCNDKRLIDALSIHSVATKYVGTFIKPWLAQAALTDGRILPKFNQVRGYDSGYGGARTGRFSSSDPNLQNVSSNVEESKNKDVLLMMQKLLLEEYEYQFRGLRDYMIPDEGKILIAVDYDQQEVRLLAHFARGVLMREYLKNPNFDVHEFCRKFVNKTTGLNLERKAIKTIVFGLIYGMGIQKLADSLEVSKKVAKIARDGVLSAVPGIKTIMNEMKHLAQHDECMTTLGGRQYFCEEPFYDKDAGYWRERDYKLTNYLIQGSAADMTKRGMVDVHNECPDVRIAVQVHDELICMATDRSAGPRIARAMCRTKLKVPLSATPKYSDYSWARAA